MNNIVAKCGVAVTLGLILLASQGCGLKWLQSDGEEGAAKASGERTTEELNEAEKAAAESRPGELSGFSQNPSEERLTPEGIATSIDLPNVSGRRLATLTKEELAAEKAAKEAGIQDVFFGYDQWIISSEGGEALNEDAAYLKDHPDAVLSIEGHCDERGTGEYNMVLGDKRAKAAKGYLLELGVNAKQVTILSLGKSGPFASTVTNHVINRIVVAICS